MPRSIQRQPIKNGTIGHIDNTAAKYGELVTMYFDAADSNNSLPEGYSYKAYLLPIENGADKPDSEPYYSSIYTEPPEITSYFIMGTDGKSSEMFDYSCIKS